MALRNRLSFVGSISVVIVVVVALIIRRRECLFEVMFCQWMVFTKLPLEDGVVERIIGDIWIVGYHMFIVFLSLLSAVEGI